MTEIPKIIEFFDNIRDRGITTKQNFYCCGKCGTLAISRLRESSDMGYCFFHEQDAKNGSDTGRLHLHWGGYSDDELDSLIVANAILDEAKACGIKAEWDGSLNNRIRLVDIDKSYFDRFYEKMDQDLEID